MNSSVVLVLAIFGLSLQVNKVFADGEGNTGHRHRHHHRHSSPASESAEFVAAYRTTTTASPPQQNDDNDEVESDVEGSRSSNGLESRLASLEQDVRHLCMEDEEDVERSIRYLGVKCKCPKTEAPVCGSDDVTYYNRCYLQCRAQQAATSYHRYKITLKKFGRC